MLFTVLMLWQPGHVLAVRSETEPLLRQGPFSNAPLLGALQPTPAAVALGG